MCVCPLPARYFSGQVEFLQRAASGRFYFNGREHLGNIIQIPCGQCVECRLKRSREWAVRAVHEASLHRFNSFLTLTYSDEYVTPSLQYFHFQGFLKRLRRSVDFRSARGDLLCTDVQKNIRFMCAGEYGETNPLTGIIDGGLYRPHYHGILFNYDFDDKKPLRLLGESDLFRSSELDRLWGFGRCVVGKVTFESAAYVARYTMKKVNGDLADKHYEYVSPDGEIIQRHPEFMVMSKRPAIGKEWFDKFGKDTYAHDAVVARGVEMQPPRYYDKLLPKVCRSMLFDVRAEKFKVHKGDHTDARNVVREEVVQAGLRQFKRS